MTTQTTTSTVGNGTMSRVFTATSTDGTYTNQTDSITSTALGLAMPNQVIDHVCSKYTAGSGLWRIISSQTNVIKRQGFMNLAGFTAYDECRIQPYKVQPDDLFQCYTVAVDATANQSNVLSLITSNRGQEAFGAVDVPDASATSITSLISGLALGDLLFGATVSNVSVQIEDGGNLGDITFVDAAGGSQATYYGNRRVPTAGGLSTLMDGNFPVRQPVQKGWLLKVNCTSA